MLFFYQSALLTRIYPRSKVRDFYRKSLEASSKQTQYRKERVREGLSQQWKNKRGKQKKQYDRMQIQEEEEEEESWNTEGRGKTEESTRC
ncbi:hypothetical protein Baya_13901 [Bagarius yarrelli]|uniref:Uncharacterized protein n=1 Tax=Bagarius yarrelli TaxID=175774 RepID=A0A556V7Z5_BAGYA|nr:hypothetical protein Baya_13901 [Bagarius yarrelli]